MLKRLMAGGIAAAMASAGALAVLAAPAHAAATVDGIIVDANGNRIHSGLIEATQVGVPEDEFPDYDTSYIDDSAYNLFLYTAGNYTLNYQGPGGYSEYYADKADAATADQITVGDVPIVLPTWTVDLPLVKGTVRTNTGAPAEGVSVNVYDSATGDPIATGYTDRDGNYYIHTGPAPVKIEFGRWGKLGGEWYSDAATMAAAHPVTPTAAGTVADATLAPAGGISGTVTSDAGVPLEFIQVSAGEDSDYTDKNGNYFIENAATGESEVTFYDPIGEYQMEYFNDVKVEALVAGAVTTKVTIVPGVMAPGINAALTPVTPPVTPPTFEMSGTVTDEAGTPLVGAMVTASSTPNAGAPSETLETVYTNRTGQYAFKTLDSFPEDAVLVHASQSEPGDDAAYSVFGHWYGGAVDRKGAVPVALTPGATVGGIDFALNRAGGIAGSVTGAAGLAFSGAVSLVGDNDNIALYSFGGDVEKDNTFDLRSIRPGTYKVFFDDNSGNHIPEWWNNATFEKAKTITVKSGQTVGGLNAVLDATLKATTRPFIDGYPWIGKRITVDKGIWNLETGTKFTYEWLVGSTVVGTGDTYTPLKSQSGDRLSVRVKAENGRLVGTATTARSAKIGVQPKLKIKVKGKTANITVKAKGVKGKKTKGKIVAKLIVKVRDNGTIKYKNLAKGKVKKGKAKLNLKKLKKGKSQVVFFYTGQGKIGSTEVKKKVKVK